ncbi:MAG: hypothetical protein FE042_06305 [Thermoplasmata archaeon]|nr:MAG: hypothetical protein FE042_06305 [Thermoplasmata archaeon]
MSLTRYKKFCYNVFGKFTQGSVTEKLKRDILRANLNIRPEAYLAYVWMNSLLSFVFAFTILTILLFVLPYLGVNILSNFLSKPSESILKFLLIVLLSFGVGITVYISLMYYPSSRATRRSKNIDQNLPYALGFIAAMASAGVPPHEIFVSLSKQKAYGEIRNEAIRIAKDIKLLGLDMISALKRAAEKTPSARFRDFLQGAIITVATGGSLKSYFMEKAEQYMRENRIEQKRFLDSLGVMAEAYVTVAVAGPLLIMVVIPLLIIISQSSSHLPLLYMFVGLIFPLIHICFSMVIKLATPTEV